MSDPQVGQGVWSEARWLDSKQPNGKISSIDWHDREVHVRFYDDGVHEAYEWEQFEYFNERLNQWVL